MFVCVYIYRWWDLVAIQVTHHYVIPTSWCMAGRYQTLQTRAQLVIIISR